jgi:hypothetical protein
MASHIRTDEDNGAAVVAHGLLNSMAVVSSGIMTVWEHWGDLSPARRDLLFGRILAQTEFVSEALKELTQGLPEGALTELETLQMGRPPQPTQRSK